jgi:diadenosine tetraphosphatase ApaH/serine/threonine PP2A family protein phosphatase
MLAILYDIHGNLPALDAVLGDAVNRTHPPADRFLLGGDYAAFGAWPLECVERLEALPDATWIRGNWERWQGDPTAAPDSPVVQGAAAAVVTALGPARVARGAQLPATVELEDTLFCHASPLSDREPFPIESNPDEEDQLLANVTQRRVVFGHTHIQFSRTTTRGVELVNPGSVGLPWDGDTRAAYALLDADGGVHLRRVEYDMERAAGALDAMAEPWAQTVAAQLRQARFEV